MRLTELSWAELGWRTEHTYIHRKLAGSLTNCQVEERIDEENKAKQSFPSRTLRKVVIITEWSCSSSKKWNETARHESTGERKGSEFNAVCSKSAVCIVWRTVQCGFIGDRILKGWMPWPDLCADYNAIIYRETLCVCADVVNQSEKGSSHVLFYTAVCYA